MPLFLELVRQVSQSNATLARRALDGLDTYASAERPPERPLRPSIAEKDSAMLRDHGGAGAPLVLVPSLINPPDILDLDSETSLADVLTAMGRRVLLLDWGPAKDRNELDVAGHVENLLVPLLRDLGDPAALVGYCLGGTITIAAATLIAVERLATLAAPWHFDRYPGDARQSLEQLWEQSEQPAERLGALPMEVLQAGFWALDPERTVAKFAEFADLDPGSDKARRFVTLEDWANEGEPLPLAAARELFEDLFRDNLTGKGQWGVGGRIVAERPSVPTLHLVAGEDRIVPAATAPTGDQQVIAAGHVGMVVGRVRTELHRHLRSFLGE